MYILIKPIPCSFKTLKFSGIVFSFSCQLRMDIYWDDKKYAIISNSPGRYGKGFENVKAAIENNQVLAIDQHANQEKYPEQKC